MKIIDYTVVCDQYRDRFASAVCDKITEGWQPFGNLEVVKYDASNLYCQAMVKYEEQTNG